MAVGFVTNTRITHGTPAALYAKGISRHIEYDVIAKNYGDDCTDIAKQLLSYPASNFKVMMGGGANFLKDKSRGGSREDGINIDLEWKKLGGRRKLLNNVRDLQAVTESDGKLLGIFAPSHFPIYVEEQIVGKKTVPRLVEMTEKAIGQLQYDEKGFFLMVEGGMIDVMEHTNQMHFAFGELYEFEEAIRKAREMTDPSETLIIVTADHGHALTMPGYLPVQESLFGSDIIKHFFGDEEITLEVPSIFFATGPGYRGGYRLIGDYIDKEEREQPHSALPSAIPVNSGHHGGEDVGLWADGPLSELFASTLENTEVAYIIKFLLCAKHLDYTFCNASALIETSTQDKSVE
ncbi:alkaline phosphatase family protein, partial [Necator americanus]